MNVQIMKLIYTLLFVYCFSAFAQKQYTFDYIIEYLGEVNSISFEAPNRIRVERIIPKVVEKTIDLRKILY